MGGSPAGGDAGPQVPSLCGSAVPKCLRVLHFPCMGGRETAWRAEEVCNKEAKD